MFSKISVEALAPLVAIVTSLAAIVGLWIELKRSRLALQTESLLSMEERFNSPEMVKTRMEAAKKLMEGDERNPELYDVLDFFYMVAALVKRKAVDRRLGEDFYVYQLTYYWIAAKEHVGEVRNRVPGAWDYVEEIAIVFQRRNPTISWSLDSAMGFIRQEARVDSGRSDSNHV
jgi:hypothetical protein